MGDGKAKSRSNLSSLDEHQRRYGKLRRLYLSALGLTAFSTVFLPLALVARTLIMGGNPTGVLDFCWRNEPPDVPRIGEGTRTTWQNTPLPFGIICRYGENLEIETFTDTGTPFIVAGIVCVVIAVVMLVVHTHHRRRLDAEVLAIFGAEHTTSGGESGRAPKLARQGGQDHDETLR